MSNEPWQNPATPNKHYTRSKLEPWAVIDVWFRDWPGNARTAYYLGSALKYVARAGHKDGEPLLKDLRKALDFVTKAVRSEEDLEVEGSFE